MNESMEISNNNTAGTYGPDEENSGYQCLCCKPAIIKYVQSTAKGNQGRPYASCADGNCKYFAFADAPKKDWVRYEQKYHAPTYHPPTSFKFNNPSRFVANKGFGNYRNAGAYSTQSHGSNNNKTFTNDPSGSNQMAFSHASGAANTNITNAGQAAAEPDSIEQLQKELSTEIAAIRQELNELKTEYQSFKQTVEDYIRACEQ